MPRIPGRLAKANAVFVNYFCCGKSFRWAGCRRCPCFIVWGLPTFASPPEGLCRSTFIVPGKTHDASRNSSRTASKLAIGFFISPPPWILPTAIHHAAMVGIWGLPVTPVMMNHTVLLYVARVYEFFRGQSGGAIDRKTCGQNCYRATDLTTSSLMFWAVRHKGMLTGERGRPHMGCNAAHLSCSAAPQLHTHTHIAVCTNSVDNCCTSASLHAAY